MENAIMDDERVLEAAVIAVPDEKWDERPAAYVVLRDGESVTADEIREGLLKTFAKWQLPDTIEFVAELPRTSVGKLDKKVLRSQHLGEDAS
jgi:fatty-acyl-CoA synthase